MEIEQKNSVLKNSLNYLIQLNCYQFYSKASTYLIFILLNRYFESFLFLSVPTWTSPNRKLQ